MQRNDRMALPVLAGLVLAVVIGVYALGAAGHDQGLSSDESEDTSVEYLDDAGGTAEPRPRSYGPTPGTGLAGSSGPSVVVLSQQCQAGVLAVTVRARDSYAARRGVTEVTVHRQGADGTWSGAPARWLGDDTGAGDRWAAELPGAQPGAGNSLRVVATDDSGDDSTTLATVTASC